MKDFIGQTIVKSRRIHRTFAARLELHYLLPIESTLHFHLFLDITPYNKPPSYILNLL